MPGRPSREAAESRRIGNVLFDLDGCLWFGDRVAPDAPEVVAELRKRGYRLFFLTNASGKNDEQLAEKLNSFGIDAVAGQVLAPLTVAHRHEALSDGARALVVGKPVIAETLRAKGVEVVDDPTEATVVVVGNWGALRFSDLIPAITALDGGATLLALNLDRRVPTADANAPGTGAIARALATATRAPIHSVGKPTRFFFEGALERFGVSSEETVMVGDSPDTDIRGGRSVGMMTVLIGESEPADEEETPDLQVPDLRSLLEHLPSVTEGVRTV